MINLYNGPLNEITIIKVLDSGIDCFDEVVNSTNIVNCYLFDFCFIICH